MSTSSTTSLEYSPFAELDGGSDTRAVAFSPDGKYLVSGHKDTVRMWKMEDGKWQMERILETALSSAQCLSVANNSEWIAAGATMGRVFVWDARTLERKLALTVDGYYSNNGVDFSPGQTSRLVVASASTTATVFEVATGERVLSLRCRSSGVIAAKFSAKGDCIATATVNSVRVWDASDGRVLADIKVTVTPQFNTGLLLFKDHLFVISSNNKLKEFNLSTCSESGCEVSEWTVPKSHLTSCIALLNHGKLIAHSSEHEIILWDTSTHAQSAVIKDPQYIQSIALSPDDRFLAIGGDHGNISIRARCHNNTDPVRSLSTLHPTFQEPDIRIDDAVFDSWKNDRLEDAEGQLTTTIAESLDQNHHLLACRALVRARKRAWDDTLIDAETVIDVQPSVIAYIAKGIAHVGNGERHKGYRTCDIALERFHSSHITFLLLIKAIIVFMAGECEDALSRLDDLIVTVHHNSICCIVQAYMHLLLGNEHMQCGDHDNAIASFDRARSQMRDHKSRSLAMVSLIFGWDFDNLCITIQRRLCEALYEAGRIKNSVDIFHQIMNELGEETNPEADYLEWTIDFRGRALERSEHLGDVATDAQRHEEAITHYTTTLSFNPPSPQDILIKRCKSFVATGLLKEAVDDADQVIKLDPSSPSGYEMKREVRLKAKDNDGAADVLNLMLSRGVRSPHPGVPQYGDKYISPSSVQAAIRKIVQKTLCHVPRVLINTVTGRLQSRAEQASAFESEPIFKELVSSMETHIDYSRIKVEVRQYFRYVMLSHKWEDNEPLYQQMLHVTVYDLEKSLTHDKLQTFCKIVWDAGIIWAWSDTCCINKSDHFVLQEALVAMFEWYRGSFMTIVFLRGVRSSSQKGALARSIWNSRAWTLQEYIAAKVIRFYTEDWTLYLNLDLPNHKEAREVILEMEKATGVSAEQFTAVQPGLTSIREKLRLASTRETTRVEDAAYSLLGIFSVAGLSAIYGEGEKSLGRLLDHVLGRSGDVSILAWTGDSGSYNSCLPAHITVFNKSATSHLPQPILDDEMENLIAAQRTCAFDLDAALRLYDCLCELPPPLFVATRMKLPCIAFQLPPLMPYRTHSSHVFRASTVHFGTIEIKTRHDLSRVGPLYLIHPWIEAMLDREHAHAFIGEDIAPPLSPISEAISGEDIDRDPSVVAEPEFSPRPALVHTVPMDRETRARRLVARLRQPFGALLVALASGGRDYRRVAADSLVIVQFQENVSLTYILDKVQTLDIL